MYKTVSQWENILFAFCPEFLEHMLCFQEYFSNVLTKFGGPRLAEFPQLLIKLVHRFIVLYIYVHCERKGLDCVQCVYFPV